MGARFSWGLVAFAATAVTIAVVPALGARASDPGNAVMGKQVFVQFCGKCHALAAVGAKGTLGPNLDRDKINFNCVVSAVEQGVGGIQAEYVLRQVTFQQVYDVAKFVMAARQKGGSAGESCGIA